MPAWAAWLERRPALQSLRRALPAGAIRLVTVRHARQLEGLLHAQLLDGVVLGLESVRSGALGTLRHDYPTIPTLLFAPIRSEDAATVGWLERQGTPVLLEGLDEPLLAARAAETGFTGRRLSALLPLADRLDLTDALQRRAWEAIIRAAPVGLSTAALARQVGLTREALSRRFAAGRAPGLKAAIDGVRLVAAGQLLGSPGWRVADAARLLGYSSESLLQRTARRLVGTGARALGSLPPERIVARLRPPGPGRWA